MMSPSTSEYQQKVNNDLQLPRTCALVRGNSVPQVINRDTRHKNLLAEASWPSTCEPRKVQEAEGRRLRVPIVPVRGECIGPCSRIRASSRPGRGRRKKYPWA